MIPANKSIHLSSRKNEASGADDRGRSTAAPNPDGGDGFWSDLASRHKIGDAIRVPAAALEGRRSSSRRIDLQEMTEDQVKSLREDDPFLYYSIPGVRAAEFSSKQVDFSDVQALCGSEGALDTVGWENGSGEHRRSPRGTTVQRNSRVSFECHPDLVMLEMMEELDGLSVEDDGSQSVEEELALLRSLAERNGGRRRE